ncbi:MAG: Flp pilus assembly complex ATPase component TadA, partial [Clostridiales bacterium]|nr:Flp pilus assembly complex ATPase component TadA [Clostridiales bacterium]
MSFIEIMQHAVEIGASDVFIISGREVSAKVGKSFVKIGGERVMPDASRLIVEEAYVSGGRDITRLQTTGDDDFAISVPGLARMRMSAFKQRGSLAAVVRIVSFGIPDYKTLGIPENVMNAVNTNKGLVLVTGAAGSGKSTTLACMIDRINKTREGHIITLEDPIEFLYRNDKSIISQREIEIDTKDYVSALRACLRQAPDVILLGEMRDYETIKTAMTAAETGHL